MISEKSFIQKGLCYLLAMLMATFSMAFFPSEARATDPTKSLAAAEEKYADSQMTLSEAKARMDVISEEYSQLDQEIAAMQEEIDLLASKVLEAQQAMLDGRSALSNTVIYEYQNDTLSTILNAIFGSKDFSELSKNMEYIDQIMDHQSQEVNNQRQLRDEFTQVSNRLTTQKNEQEAKLDQLNVKREEATTVLEQAEQAADANAEEVAALKKQAEQFIWKTTDDPEPEIVDDADTVNRGEAVSENTPVIPDPVKEDTSNDSGSSSSGWLTGQASAYGGSSDPTTPNPGITATGARCDDNSKGVALPMSMPNYRSYFGRTVEIKYNGMTVYATVNDCGGLRGGARKLDLQPGVFKAFGYSTCQEWGVRNVTYRFL